MVLRAVLTVAIFALLGPLVGGLVTIVGLVVFGAGGISAGDAAAAILAMVIYGLWVAYPLGIVPATLVGLLIAGLDGFRGGTSLLVALAVGAAAGLLFGFAAVPAGDNRLVGVLIVAGSLAATVLCWWATRPLRRLVA